MWAITLFCGYVCDRWYSYIPVAVAASFISVLIHGERWHLPTLAQLFAAFLLINLAAGACGVIARRVLKWH